MSAGTNYDIDSCELEVSKHFKTKYMRKWNWDYKDLRDAIKEAKTVRVGKNKFEAFYGNKQKIVFVYYPEFNAIFVISGAEG